MKAIIKWIPNLITLGNLLCGMISCILSLKMVPAYEGQDFSMLDPWYRVAPSLFIFGAAILDFFDGFAARLLKVHSELGKQLDSLADVVSFGVAPSFIILGYNLINDWSAMGLLLGIFAAVRLAKFNIDTRQSESFLGLPVPSTGMIIASLPFVEPEGLLGFMIRPEAVAFMVIVLCLLMVSELPLLALKFKTFSFSENIPRYLLLISGLIILLIFKIQGIPLIIGIYIAISLFSRKIKT